MSVIRNFIYRTPGRERLGMRLETDMYNVRDSVLLQDVLGCIQGGDSMSRL